MFESLAGITGLKFIDEEALPPRRCAFHNPVQTDERYLKDLRSYHFDEHGRLSEVVSKSGFRTQFVYRDAKGLEMRAYHVLDPNHATFERAVRQNDGRWVVERLNPAKGKMEMVANSFTHLSVGKAGNVNRIDANGKLNVLNVRIERQQMLNSLVDFVWQG